jgi:translation initiation factor IF-1
LAYPGQTEEMVPDGRICVHLENGHEAVALMAGMTLADHIQAAFL